MPLTMADIGEEVIIRRVGGSQDIKQHLADLGFVAGGRVTVIQVLAGNLIISVKGTRVALNREMAQKIMV